MQIELDVKVQPGEDGQGVLTVSGPIDGVLLAYRIVLEGLGLYTDETPDEGLSDSSVG